jgi:hypothetical protein
MACSRDGVCHHHLQEDKDDLFLPYWIIFGMDWL